MIYRPLDLLMWGRQLPSLSILWTEFLIMSVEALWKLSKVTDETAPLILEEILLETSPTKSFTEKSLAHLAESFLSSISNFHLKESLR